MFNQFVNFLGVVGFEFPEIPTIVDVFPFFIMVLFFLHFVDELLDVFKYTISVLSSAKDIGGK